MANPTPEQEQVWREAGRFIRRMRDDGILQITEFGYRLKMPEGKR